MRPSARHTGRCAGTSLASCTHTVDTQCGGVPLSVEQSALAPQGRGSITEPLKQWPMVVALAQISCSPVAGQREASQCAPPTMEHACPAGHAVRVGAPWASQWSRSPPVIQQPSWATGTSSWFATQNTDSQRATPVRVEQNDAYAAQSPCDVSAPLLQCPMCVSLQQTSVSPLGGQNAKTQRAPAPSATQRAP